MTYDYGDGSPPRGQGQFWGQPNYPADVHPSPHSDVRPQRPSYEPRPQQAGEGQHGSRRPYAAGHGQSQSPQWNQAEPGAGFRTPHQHPAARGEQYGATRHEPRAPFHEPKGAGAGPKARRRSRKPLVFAIIFVMLVAGGGAGWYYLRGSANQPRTEQELRVADQQVDPVPLSATEVFGSETIPGGQGPYKVLKTQASTDCKTAVGGAIAEILTTAGCTQVVRATLMPSDGALVITTGIFNLETEEKADKASAAIKEAVDSQKGRFSGLVAGGASDVISRAAANLAWDARGHYLVYCLVTKADGSAIAADDPRTQPVRKDLVDRYLGDIVIHKRETLAGPTAVPPTP